MLHSQFLSILFVSMMATLLVSAYAIWSINILSFATSSLDQSFQQNQQDLQSTIDSQVQQSITDTINNINNSNNSSISNMVRDPTKY